MHSRNSYKIFIRGKRNSGNIDASVINVNAPIETAGGHVTSITFPWKDKVLLEIPLHRVLAIETRIISTICLLMHQN